MSTRAKSTAAAAAAALALLVAGCGSPQAEPAADGQAVKHAGPARPATAAKEPAAATAAQPVSRAGTAEAAAPASERPEDVPVEDVPTELPPGDPGLDAPSVPDPGVPEDAREHEEPARTNVPAEAMLDAQLVSGVLGGDWQQREAVNLEPVSVPEAVAERTVAFATESGQGPAEVVQTVATHRGLAAADRAVAAAGRQLASRGWSELPDPRLGTASVALQSKDGSRTAVLLSAEAVTVALVGSEAATAGPRWASLLDVALGSSCAAAPHGCH